MSRCSFFERMEREIDFQREYEKIEIIILNECDIPSKTINDEISIAFRKWEHRQNYLSFDELRNDLGFTYEKSIKHHGLYFPTGTVKEIDTFLLYCEMIENFFNFVMPRTNNVQRIAHIEKTIFYDLDRINHKFHNYDDGRVIIVQKDATVSAVADVVEPVLANEIVRYNHYLLKGDLEAKRAILKRIADSLEPFREELKLHNKTIENDFFFLVNNMNIRHNNCDPKDLKRYCKVFADFSDKEKENLYDEIYQEALMAYLVLEQINREKMISTLRQKINNDK